ncbi:hypothetical protein CC78DRAFT_583565 [Lojkania enalia]|uniref:Uncharacterized protein n=1 Tax=Lojkania enalia TaxID=147567 RepID=A0A9P4K3Q4_9PLEO|nr:hypothetical protein CC78DRAFT_583565 [Didymosphaeria enalia]
MNDCRQAYLQMIEEQWWVGWRVRRPPGRGAFIDIVQGTAGVTARAIESVETAVPCSGGLQRRVDHVTFTNSVDQTLARAKATGTIPTFGQRRRASFRLMWPGVWRRPFMLVRPRGETATKLVRKVAKGRPVQSGPGRPQLEVPRARRRPCEAQILAVRTSPRCFRRSATKADSGTSDDPG